MVKKYLLDTLSPMLFEVFVPELGANRVTAWPLRSGSGTARQV